MKKPIKGMWYYEFSQNISMHKLNCYQHSTFGFWILQTYLNINSLLKVVLIFSTFLF